MTNPTIPFNAIPIGRNDIGKRVVVNSLGGPSWPDNKWKRGLENVGGVIVWGPYKFWYMAKAAVEGQNVKFGYRPILKDKKFITEPYWGVLLDGYKLEIQFVEAELTFI